MSPERLRAILHDRLVGDRSGVCVAAAFVEEAGPAFEGYVSTAIVAADPAHGRSLDGRTAFEIGSITKTMTGALLADLVLAGRVGLADPLAAHVPAGVRVPDFDGAAIRLLHLATHTSGLPSLPARMPDGPEDNPYARLTEEALWGSLAEAELEQAPGDHWTYSNFGLMALSCVLARVAGRPFEALLTERLFAPLGMRAFVSRPPPGVVAARGHIRGGKVTSPWDFQSSLAGAGGVRASLEDMVRYAQAALGWGDRRVVASVSASQEPIDLPALEGALGQMGLGWMRRTTREGRAVLCHGGGTGGFTAHLAIDRQLGDAVVLLADTALHNTGELDDLGRALLEGMYPQGSPRRLAVPPPALLQRLVGRHRLADGRGVTLTARDGRLFCQVDGEVELALGYDSEGDFFPLEIDALITPRPAGPGAGDRMTFTFRRLGLELEATAVSDRP